MPSSSRTKEESSKEKSSSKERSSSKEKSSSSKSKTEETPKKEEPPKLRPSEIRAMRLEAAWRSHVGKLTLAQMSNSEACLQHLARYGEQQGWEETLGEGDVGEVIAEYLKSRIAPRADAMLSLVHMEQGFAHSRAVEEILVQSRIAAEQGVGRTAWIELSQLRSFKPWMAGPPQGYKRIIATLEEMGYAAHAEASPDDKQIKLRVSCLPGDREAALPGRAKPRMPWWQQPSALAPPPPEEEEEVIEAPTPAGSQMLTRDASLATTIVSQSVAGGGGGGTPAQEAPSTPEPPLLVPTDPSGGEGSALGRRLEEAPP